jgi:hypothetical protein
MPMGPSAPAPSESTSLDFELVQRLTFGRIFSGDSFRSFGLKCGHISSTTTPALGVVNARVGSFAVSSITCNLDEILFGEDCGLFPIDCP